MIGTADKSQKTITSAAIESAGTNAAPVPAAGTEDQWFFGGVTNIPQNCPHATLTMSGTIKAYELTDDLQKMIDTWRPVTAGLGIFGSISSGNLPGTLESHVLQNRNKFKVLEEEKAKVNVEWKPNRDPANKVYVTP